MTEINSYRKEKLTMDVVKANIYAIIFTVPVLVLYGVPFYLLNKNGSPIEDFEGLIHGMIEGSGAFSLPFLIMAILILGIVVHELIHGAVWAPFTKNGFKSIKFGVLLKMLTPYCHCKEPLLIKHYLLGVIMPAIILGVLPSVYGIVNGNLGFLIFGIFFTVAAAGDLIMVYLLRNEKMNELVQDHPSEMGCFVFRK